MFLPSIASTDKRNRASDLLIFRDELAKGQFARFLDKPGQPRLEIGKTMPILNLPFNSEFPIRDILIANFRYRTMISNIE